MQINKVENLHFDRILITSFKIPCGSVPKHNCKNGVFVQRIMNYEF